jgi:hypothetical protein
MIIYSDKQLSNRASSSVCALQRPGPRNVGSGDERVALPQTVIDCDAARFPGFPRYQSWDLVAVYGLPLDSMTVFISTHWKTVLGNIRPNKCELTSKRNLRTNCGV